MLNNLKNEQQIMASWLSRYTAPLVSICCPAYNHEKYIQEMLAGILNQETDFPFEIIIHDDASTDRTAEIIRDYQSRYPAIIKTVLQTENQLSQGKRITQSLLPLCNGEFVAFCEGDDYWDDVHKLARQVVAMQKNPGYNLSCHPVKKLVFDKDRLVSTETGYGDYGKEEMCIGSTVIIQQMGAAMGLSSMMIRPGPLLKIKKEYPDAVLKYATHFFFQVVSAGEKGALYLPQYMSCYRSMHSSSWSYRMKTSPEFKTRAVDTFMEMVSFLQDVCSEKQQKDLIQAARRKLLSFIRTKDVALANKYSLWNKYGSEISMSLAEFMYRVIRSFVANLVR